MIPYKQWYELPNGKTIAFVSRSGTSSLGLMLLQKFFPESVPESKEIYSGTNHRLLPWRLGQTLPPKTCVAIRNPVERFASLCNKTRTLPIDALRRLYWLFGLGPHQPPCRMCLETTNIDWLYHFAPVSMIAQKDSILFSFPAVRTIADYCGASNIQEEHINRTDHIVLTPDEQTAVLSAYSHDIKIWKSLQ